MAKARPLVALVGRPNVGKSTLFNRLIGARLAVVDDTPGTTRDRLVAEAEWAGVLFDVVDTGGLDPTAGQHGKPPLSIGSAAFIEEIRRQAEAAIREADAVLFLVDVESGVTPADREVADILRRFQQERQGRRHPPIFLVVNKCDDLTDREALYEFYELGVGEPFPISALHGRGVGDLLDALVQALPYAPSALAEEVEEEDTPKIAIVGRPNVGKSSLLNRLLGQERVIVSDIPGTTRDPVDTEITYYGRRLVLIDTAGIRRRGRIEPGVEKFSVLRTLRAIRRADVAVLLIDAVEGVTAQDAHVAGFVLDAWKPLVIAVNKWDAIEKDTYTINLYTQRVRQALNFVDYAPLLFISAKTGQRVHQVIPTALQVWENSRKRLPTSRVNRLLQEAVLHHSPPARGGKTLKIYFGAQVAVAPPTFVLRVNDPGLAHFTYLRYLENRFREAEDFTGTPLRFILRKREH